MEVLDNTPYRSLKRSLNYPFGSGELERVPLHVRDYVPDLVNMKAEPFYYDENQHKGYCGYFLKCMKNLRSDHTSERMGVDLDLGFENWPYCYESIKAS